MTHKIPAHLVDTHGHRVESHLLLTSGPGMTADDVRDVRQFLERRAHLLGRKLAGQWHMSLGEVRVWCHAEPVEAAK